ncbi:MAG: DNA-protecting protein DprA [Spartobacteria bacterium]|nr:DNA-protecting protein DprA [Spartobacteria bacterium]
MNERLAYIALNMIDGIGPVKVRALVDALGAPREVLNANEETLRRVPGIGPRLAAGIVTQRSSVNPMNEEEEADRLGARIITQLDADYPARLKTIHDPPLALYMAGTLTDADQHAIAMVGSRRATHYGKMMADRLSQQLAQVGYTVVSGLARGIDTAAHQGALKAGGRTIAVLGGALDKLYPPDNAGLAKMIATQGAVISEYPFGREPDRTTFPYRNRIVSGLSQGVVVVEAPIKSGSLITADMAMEQGRQVFAVPGRVDNPNVRGCHRLIRQGACLVETVDDILEDFETLLPSDKREKARELGKRPDVRLSPEEKHLVSALGGGPLDVDSLTREAGLKSHQVSSLLLGLEMKRVIRMQPGRMVELSVTLDDLR